MASVFPEQIDGGTVVRDSAGNPVPAPNVANAYVPASDFTVSCSYTMLSNDCFTRVSPSQVNAIVSEMVCFAETLDPTGEWDCSTLCNISTAFTTYMENFSSAEIGTQICGLPDGDGLEAAPRLLYCYANEAKGLAITGDDSLLNIFFNALCASDVEAASYADAMVLYCGTDGLRKTSVFSIQLFRGEWVQAYSYQPNQMVRHNGALWSPNDTIPGGTPFTVGTTGATWYEVSASYAPVWQASNSYLKDDVVIRNGVYYAANANIAAGTPFTVGTAGATWRVVNPTRTRIMDYNPAAVYRKDEVVASSGLIYRARGDVPAAAPFDATNWELLGGEKNIYRGAYDQANAYLQNDMVLRDGRFYVANSDIVAGTPFVVGTSPNQWRRVGVDPNFDIVVNAFGGWQATDVLALYPAYSDFVLPANLIGSRVVIEGGSTITANISIRRNGAEVGQININTGVVTFAFPTATQINGGTGTLSLVALDDAVFSAFALNLVVERRQ